MPTKDTLRSLFTDPGGKGQVSVLDFHGRDPSWSRSAQGVSLKVEGCQVVAEVNESQNLFLL